MLSIVIPMYNEQGTVEHTVFQLKLFFEQNKMDYEIVLVDDGSTDMTDSVARALCCDNVIFTGYKPNKGKGYAIRFGSEAAKGSELCFVDSDLSYGLEIIADGLRLLLDSGSDIVIGSRRLKKESYKNYPLIRRFASSAFSLAVSVITGIRQKDTQCGFKIYTAAAAKKLFPKCRVDGFAIDLEVLMMASRLQMKISEIPACVINHGRSKVNMATEPFKMLLDAVKIRIWHSAEAKCEKEV